MPKRYGVKEKDQVVEHVINLVMTGKLRTGDRIDRNEIAKDLGLSRMPIQEAMVQLEHDGIVSTRYHRGAFVERFDETTVRENHELYGILTGRASARAAANPTPRIRAQLDAAMRTLRAAKDAKAFQEARWGTAAQSTTHTPGRGYTRRSARRRALRRPISGCPTRRANPTSCPPTRTKPRRSASVTPRRRGRYACAAPT